MHYDGVNRRAGLFCTFIAASTLLFLLSCSSGLYAQDYLYAVGKPSFATTIPVENGFINISNGNLHFEIDLGSGLPQRGTLSSDVRLVYDSRIWHFVTTPSLSWKPDNIPGSQGGWRLVTPATGNVISRTTAELCRNVLTDFLRDSWTWTDPEGTTHFFDMETIEPVSGGCTVTGIPSANAFASDGSGFHAYVTNYTNVTIFANDGTQVYPTLKDPNGNYFSPGANGGLLIDTLQRSPVNVTQSGATTYYDVLTWQGQRARYTVTTETIPVSTGFQQSAVAEYTGNITVIQSVQLPNGSSYSFTYDSGAYGELTGISLPTGGQITYGYSNYLDSYQNKNRWITSRAADGGTWYFNPAVVTQCATGTTGCKEKVTVTRPGNNTTLNTTTAADDIVYTFTLNNGAWNSQVDYYTGSAANNVLLASALTDYDFSNLCGTTCTGSQFIKTIRNTVILPNGKSSKIEYTYDNPQYRNITAIKEWDYYPTNSPPASPYRETDLTYKTDAAYLAKNIINKVSSIVVKDSGGTPQSQTQLFYDESSIPPLNGVMQHDDINFPNTMLVRGNVTTLKRWLQGTGGAADRWITTTSTYDQLGNAVGQTDPLGNSTTFAYSSTNSYAYLTQVTRPDTTSTNPPSTTHHVTSRSYDPFSGFVASDTDENSQTTTYGYDSLGRLTSTQYPSGGGQITVSYPDIWTTVTTETVDSAGSTRLTYAHRDAFGRTDRTAVTNDKGTYDQADRCFDARGQVSYDSYPYQGSGFNTTKSCTGNGDSYIYDGLGRLSDIMHSDSSFVGVSFSGAARVYFDERTTLTSVEQYDAFNRIVSVCEVSATSYINSGSPSACGQDYAATGYLTSYQYNILDRPVQINQGGASVRIKSYDSLGRLTTDSIPEMGGTPAAIAYAYDDNNHLVQRKRPKANQADAAQILTTTYSYDPLGRLRSIAYDDGVTPTVQYYYDDTTVSGRSGSMGIGRHTSEMVGGAYPNSASFFFDAVGNVLYDNQATPRIYGSGQYTMAYQHNFDGSFTSFTNGATNITYSYQHNSGAAIGGNTTGLTSSVSDSTHPATLLSGIQYGPFGPTQMLYGNGVTEQLGYSARGQLSSKSSISGPIPIGVTKASASITLSGQPYFDGINCDVGYVTMSVGAASTAPITYDCFFTAAQMAQALVNNFSSTTVTASANQGTITLTAIQAGSGGNSIAFSFTYQSSFPGQFPPPYTFSPASGHLSGGTDSVITPTVYSFTHQIGSDERLISTTDSVMGNISFGYDDLGHLNSAAGFTWDFDRYGNRWHQNGTQSLQEIFDVNNHGSTVTYDILGNIANDGVHSYRYDAENRIIAVDNGSTATYAYDAEGRRIRKSTSAGISEFLYDLDDNIVTEIGPSNTWTRTEIYYDDGTHIGTYTNTPGNIATYFTFTDWEDTERVRTDWAGNVVETCTSLMYGDGLTCTGSDTSPIHFTGYEHDFESGLDYANNRYYNARLGRFMTADIFEGSPGSPRSFNRYSYVLGDPANYVDPSGNLASVAGGAACGPACAAVGALVDLLSLFSFFGFGHHAPAFFGSTQMRPPGPNISVAAYTNCVKQAFGKPATDDKGKPNTIPNSDKSIPSYDAANDIMNASLARGADPASVGVTMAHESNFNLGMPTQQNTNGTFDYGPMQVNSGNANTAKFPGAAGTPKKGAPFSGDPLANTMAGAEYLKKFRNPARYVGKLSSPQAKARTKLYHKIYKTMKKFTDCLAASISGSK
jgi:RHS repeat-associated protein